MKITKGLKYRIYPNKQQRIMIGKTLGCSRFVYNHFLRVRMDEWSYNHNSLSYESTCPMLKDLKKYPEYSWLKEVDSTALQQSLRDLQKSYDNIKADKAKSTEKIDGAIALIMALDRAIRCGNVDGESVYENRGLLVL